MDTVASAGKSNSKDVDNEEGGFTPHIFTVSDLRAQSAFLRWYITSLRQHWQTDADGQFGRTLALCGGLLDGEPNVLGVARLVELFGEDVVREQALKAVQLSGQGQAAVREQTGRAERTIGGILFYLLRQHYRQVQPSQPAQHEHQQQQELSLPTTEEATALSAVVSHTQTDNQPQPVQPDVTLSSPGLNVTPTSVPGIYADTHADVTFALDTQEQEQEQKLRVTSTSNQTETQSQSRGNIMVATSQQPGAGVNKSEGEGEKEQGNITEGKGETEREETGEDDGWQGLKIPFLRLRYHRLIGSQSASAPVSSVDVTPSLTTTPATSGDTNTDSETNQAGYANNDVTSPSTRASAGDNRWHEKLTFNAVALGTGSGSGTGFDRLRQSYPAEFGNYVALERELCQLVVNMTNALVGGDKLWDTVSFQKVVSQIFGKRGRY
jgi:hypothetical protein